MIEPHGGKLINKIKKLNTENFGNLLALNLNSEQIMDVKNIAHGVYSPLEGFMNRADFESVLEKGKLANGIVWTIPILLDVSQKIYKSISLNSEILLKNTDQKPLAIMRVKSKYNFDKNLYNQKVFATTNPEHPGVKKILQANNYIIGGEIFLLNDDNDIFPDHNLTPQKTREIFQQKGWTTVTGFQTRNPAHLGHEFIQKMALEFVDGIFINPIIGPKKVGDFKDEVTLKVYDFIVNNYYPQDKAFLSILTAKMNYAGPKEAVLHAIIRKNFGCTHFIVGRDHAGVGNFYDKFAAHKIFDQIEDIGIKIMKVSAAFFCKKCNFVTTEKSCPHGKDDWFMPSGTEIRKMVQEKNVDKLKNIMRKEVVDIILNFKEPFIQ